MDKLDIKIEKLDGSELIIRTGTALPLEVPKAISISGDIKTVSEFIRLRASEFDNKKANIVISKENAGILLTTDEQSSKSIKVYGSIEKNADLKIFNINEENVILNLNQLAKLIRNNKYFFKGQDNSELMKSIEKFSFNKQVAGKIHDDRKGNKDVQTTSTLEQSVSLSFILEMPIFKGMPASSFVVEIYCDMSDAGARFWLESQDLKFLEKKLVADAISAEYEKIKDSGILTIIES